jgi:hypothetical protein
MQKSSAGRFSVPGMHGQPRWRPTAFVSYAWDSPAHKEAVCDLCQLLMQSDVDVRIDQFAGARRRDWAGWAVGQIETADYVLVIASPTYKREADGDASPTGRWGVKFEAAVLREKLYTDVPTWLPKILPVVLPGGQVDDIPIFLQPRSASHFVIDEFTRSGVAELLTVLYYRP